MSRRLLCLTLLALAALPATASAAQIEDGKVATSFDGTPIVYTLMLPDSASADQPVPAVLHTHGWGGSRSRTPSGFLQQLLDAGYAVLSWDSRGFGQSGGTVQVDSPDFEARDASALVDVLAADPRIAQEVAGDPRIGMTGGSYGGGIQFVTAARDPRVDAIAPEIAWNDLRRALWPEDVVKVGWGTLLYAGGQTALTGGLSGGPAGQQTGAYDPMIDRAFAESAAGAISQEVEDWFAAKGPHHLLSRITAPTFVIQATTDTLFTPNEAIANFTALERTLQGDRLQMAWYCGGHGSCAPFSSGPSGHIQRRVVDWFDRWVRGDDTVATGPRFAYLTDDGSWHGAGDFPVPGTKTASGRGSGVVTANSEPSTSGLLTGSVWTTALTIPVDVAPGTTIVGQPTIRLTESGLGTATNHTLRTALFFQLVNLTKDEVIGNQVLPKVVDTDGVQHTYEFPFEGLAYGVDPGDRIALQIGGTAAGYEAFRGAGAVQVHDLQISVPVR
jgi:ABC-2 type transport system ATP-binding protein